MNLKQFATAIELFGTYQRLQQLRSDASSNGLTVSIKGTYQDETFVSCARPAIVAEINKRMDHIAWELDQLGVKV